MFSEAELMRQWGCSGQETERDTSVASFSLLDDGGGDRTVQQAERRGASKRVWGDRVTKASPVAGRQAGF